MYRDEKSKRTVYGKKSGNTFLHLKVLPRRKKKRLKNLTVEPTQTRNVTVVHLEKYARVDNVHSETHRNSGLRGSEEREREGERTKINDEYPTFTKHKTFTKRKTMHCKAYVEGIAKKLQYCKTY